MALELSVATIALVLVGAFRWIIILGERVNSLADIVEKNKEHHDLKVSQLAADHDKHNIVVWAKLDAQQETLNKIHQSLGRVEGSIGVLNGK